MKFTINGQVKEFVRNPQCPTEGKLEPGTFVPQPVVTDTDRLLGGMREHIQVLFLFGVPSDIIVKRRVLLIKALRMSSGVDLPTSKTIVEAALLLECGRFADSPVASPAEAA